MTNQNLFKERSGLRLCLLAAGLPALAGIGHAQEALRLSMAGDTAAAQQQQAAATVGYYNLMMGPTAWSFTSGLALEYNDNVELQQNGQSDLIIRPNINAQMHWPVTLQNSLDVSLALGYSEYLQHADLSQFFINPGSGLSFDIYVGDFKINLHDRISITEETYENAGLSGANENLDRLQNAVGTGVLWDLGKMVANVDFDHVNYLSLSQNQNVPDSSSENVLVNAGLRVRPELMLGLEAGGSVITYSQNSSPKAFSTPDAVQWNTGAFGTEQVSDYIDVRLDAGYTAYTPDSTESGLVTSDTSGLYVSLTLSHRVNEHLNYTLTAGRTTDLSAYGQAQSYYYARLNPQWSFLKNYVISTPIWWQQGTWLYNSTAGVSDYQQVGAGFNVTRQLTQKLSVSVGYKYITETSDRANLSYTVNVVDLNLSYRF